MTQSFAASYLDTSSQRSGSPRSIKNEVDSDMAVAEEDTDQVDNNEEDENFQIPVTISQEELEKQREGVSLVPKLVKSLMH
jgi:hypothetical protein